LPNNKLIIGYVGSLGTWYLLSEMMSFFKIWLLQHPNSILFFVTNEPKELIYDEAKRQQIELTQIRLTAANRTEMPYYISMMDFGLFFIKNAYSKKASSPVKQGELMAMGVPVICNSGVGDSDFIITKYKSGELVDSFDIVGYQNTINQLMKEISHPDIIRDGALDYFDLQKGIAAYAALYESVIGIA
jgi:glycosyltransferase involved in cell wall biosynthesis